MPKKVNHENRRLQLAAAAVEVIARVGIDKLRLTDVAKQVGATTGLVTHYIGDKDAVLVAALDYVAGEMLNHEMKGTSISDLWLLLFDILPTDKNRRNHWKVWLAFWSRAANNAELANIHQRYNNQFRRSLLKIFSQQALVNPTLSAKEVADAICTTVDGIAANATIEPLNWPATKQKKQLSLMLTPLLGPPPG